MTALGSLICDFAALLTPEPGNNECLSCWIDQAQAENLPHLHAFTRGLEFDRPAVAPPSPSHSIMDELKE